MLDSHYDNPASLSPRRFVGSNPLNASSPAIWLVPGEAELHDVQKGTQGTCIYTSGDVSGLHCTQNDQGEGRKEGNVSSAIWRSS